MTASWSGSDRTYRIQVGGAKMRLNGKLPSNHHSDRRRQTLERRRKARLPVYPPSACSGLKALRNTSLAKAASRQAALAFRSLDPFRALREPDPRRRDEERPSRSEQRTLSKNQKQRLDRKSPIQVRTPLSRRRVTQTRSWRPGVAAGATGRATPAAVGEPEIKADLRAELEVRIHPPPADSLSLSRSRFRRSRTRLSARVWAAGLPTGQQRLAGCFDIASTGGNISVGPYSSTAVRLVVAPGLTRGRSVDL